jgi:hypothetical protein
LSLQSCAHFACHSQGRRFIYNQIMRSPQSSPALLFALLLACTQAWGQGTGATPPATTTAATPTHATKAPPEPRSEHIQVEDDAARIDELRVGGETRSISVSPKGGMPAYDVAPKTGERTWKVLGF